MIHAKEALDGFCDKWRGISKFEDFGRNTRAGYGDVERIAVLHEFSHECVDITTNLGIGGHT